MLKQFLRSFLFVLWAGVSAAAPVVEVPSSRLSVTVNGHVLTIPYERNLSLTGSHPQVQMATVLVHGTQRDAAQAYENMLDAADVADQSTSSTMLVAPQFLTEEDVTAHALAPDVLFWTDSGWRDGARSLDTSAHPRPETISSYAVLDSILYRIASRNTNLQMIIVAGHSAGGQLVNRYAAGNTVEQRLQSEFGVTVRYVIANPSSYMYMNAERVVAGTTDVFQVPSSQTQQSCPSYNRYKYGLLQLNSYMGRLSASQLQAQYSSRRVTYLLGQLDANPADSSMDMSCAADLQGQHRLERGLIYHNHLVDAFGATVQATHRFEVIEDVGHSSHGMFTSDCGAEVLFGAATCGTVAVGKPTLREPLGMSLRFPNPLPIPGPIEYRVPQEGVPITLRIHDMLGREVRTLLDGAGTAGAGTVLWDGRSNHGIRVAPGIYLCRLQQGAAVMTLKLAIVQG